MHDQLGQDLDQTIDDMSDAKKLELIEKLARSLRAPKSADSEGLAAAQKRRLIDSVRRIASLPMEGPGRFSGRDHDRVLYASCGKIDPPG